MSNTLLSKFDAIFVEPQRTLSAEDIVRLKGERTHYLSGLDYLNSVIPQCEQIQESAKAIRDNIAIDCGQYSSACADYVLSCLHLDNDQREHYRKAHLCYIQRIIEYFQQ